jgi:uncharacterized protein (DUF2141 family)
VMLKFIHFRYLLLATLLSLSCAKPVHAEPTANLTVVVNGIQHQSGEICMRVFSSEKGFPMHDTSEVQSGCIKINGSTVKHIFSGLKPGDYAVAVVDDQNGDRKLNKDFFGIPREGFGLSRNPIVSVDTGTPSFHDASFKLNKNTTITIKMKYSLDS